MAKREFINKNEIPFFCRHDCWTGNCIKCDEKTVAQYEIDKMSAITEEEIVKPYLEKLKTEIAGLKRFELRGAVTPLVNVNRVIELIDNILTERGAEEWID